ncbi:hypothetical protein ACFY05_31890 [Microtetraspora fusca]|uniref:Transcriptional regulator n=1 Tax=Microtetraspora fusca TaxID=1997 RepID=A0ABW6VFW7_MICFU
MSGRVTAKDLAEVFTTFSAMTELGARTITPKHVRTWYDRRATTGFPEPIPGVHAPGKGRPRLWDLNTALAWFLSAGLRKAGPPLGNMNAYKNGRYVGARAARAARQQARADCQAS